MDYYVIVAKDKKSGEDRFYDTDSNSGGYPYWSTWPRVMNKLPVIENVDSYFYGILNGVSNIRVAKVCFETYQIVEGVEDAVRRNEEKLKEQRREQLRSEISKLQKELDKIK